MFVLFNFIVRFVLGIICYIICDITDNKLFALPFLIYLLVSCLPALAVTVRRLHDIGDSGWLVLIYYVPWIIGMFMIFTGIENMILSSWLGFVQLISTIVILVKCCKPSE